MQDIFLFEREGMDADGNVMGRVRATGIRPRCAERLQQHGIDLAGTLFSEVDPRLSAVRGGA